MTLLENMPHTLDHGRPTYVEDIYGGNRRVFRPLRNGLGISCWVQNASMQEITQFEKVDQRVTHKVFFASALNIRPGDMFNIRSGPFQGRLLNVKAHTERSAGLGRVFATFCEEENNLQPDEWIDVESSQSSSLSSASLSASSVSSASSSSSETSTLSSASLTPSSASSLSSSSLSSSSQSAESSSSTEAEEHFLLQDGTIFLLQDGTKLIIGVGE